MKHLLWIVTIALGVAGCGGGNTNAEQTSSTSSPPPTTVATTTGAGPMSLKLFFLAPDRKTRRDSRNVERTQRPGSAMLHELINPDAGATTQVPDGLQLTIDGGRAQVTGATLDEAALAQVVYF